MTDFDFTKRLTRYAEVTKLSEAQVWLAAAETDFFTIKEYLEYAEIHVLTKVQQAKLKLL